MPALLGGLQAGGCRKFQAGHQRWSSLLLRGQQTRHSRQPCPPLKQPAPLTPPGWSKQGDPSHPVRLRLDRRESADMPSGRQASLLQLMASRCGEDVVQQAGLVGCLLCYGRVQRGVRYAAHGKGSQAGKRAANNLATGRQAGRRKRSGRACRAVRWSRGRQPFCSESSASSSMST